MMRLLICVSAVLLLGCDVAGRVNTEARADSPANDAPNTTLDAPTLTAPHERADDTQFIDVLAQYQALNTRLDGVAVRLQRANAALCPVTVRDVGYTVHSVGDYPQNLQEVARSLLNVSEALSIRTVRAGSTAEAAGLQAGDRLVGINGQRLAAGMTQKLFYERAARRAFGEKTASVTTARGEVLSTKTLRPETLCGYPVNVFFNEGINGHTDGEAVWVTSELMRTVNDDVNLSLIVAHEMAHAIAGHMAQDPDKSLELLADRMALVLMARAGLDIDRAVGYWDDAVHPHYDLQERSVTHPSIAERRDNLTDMAARIKKAQADGVDLDFLLTD